MLSFSNDEIKSLPEVPKDGNVVCPHCGEVHKIGYGEKKNDDGTYSPSNSLGFIKCPENGSNYIVSLNGALITSKLTPIKKTH